jgi:hypothetical protein
MQPMVMLLRQLICPFCLIEIRSLGRVAVCPECHQALPPVYIHDYATTKPFFTQVFGWSQVGKTVYLQALTLVLERMPNLWPGYAASPATDLSQQLVRDIRTYLERGIMPQATQVGETAVYIMQLYNMARWGNRTLVTRDFAGEIFDTMTISVEDVPYLPYAPTTLMMIGPDGDVSNQGGRTMEMLLNNYINTLLLHSVDFNRSPRAIVAVLTKADTIGDLPPDLRSYLISDPICAALTNPNNAPLLDDAAMENYLATMTQVSDRIQAWVYDRSAYGKNFIRTAEQRKITLRFALISSTGTAVPAGQQMSEQLAPRRVLDPYFWALEFQSE